MKKFIVKQRWLSGKGKKVWSSGDEVTERDFPENFDLLISEGRIECLTMTINGAIPEVVNEDILKEFTPKEKSFKIMRDNEEIVISDEEEITKAELVIELSKKGIPFNPTSKKAILWQKIIENL